MIRVVSFLLLALVGNLAFADPIVVNCDAGQSLNWALSKLDKHTPSTVFVKGTCAEYVKSIINGAASIAGATNVQCGNLLPGEHEPLP